MLYEIKRLSSISLLELTPGLGIQYVRSSGSSAKLVHFDLNQHTALIKLPSGVRKLFSIYSLASLGAVSLSEKKYVTNTKAGY